MLFVSLLALSPSPPASVPPRFQHTSYQRLERQVALKASGRFVLVRPTGTYRLAGVEKELAALGASTGLAGHWPMRQRLIELDLGERSTLQGLLRLAERLERRGLISDYFPVWTRPPDGRTHVDERVVLSLSDPAQEAKLLRRFGLSVAQRYPNLPGVLSVRVPGERDAIALARRLHRSGAFNWAEPDWIFHPKAMWDPSDPLFGDTWHQAGGGVVGSINAVAAWDTTRGEGVTVGVIDSGTQRDHPDLEVFAGYDLVEGDNDASPECIERPDGRGRADSCPAQRPYRESHGTAVSGIVASRSNDLGTLGVCPECRLVTIRMVGVSQRRVSHADGLRWLIAQNTAVVNNSWGPSIARYFPMAIAEEQAVADGVTQGRGGKGMLLLYAAGNDRLLNAESNPYSAHPETVTVSGSTRRDDFACYSNYGSTIDISAPTKGCFDGEPGLRTTDLVGGEGYNQGDFHNDMGGTSGACPVASGVAALIIAANPELSARQVRLVLQASAERIRADQVDWSRRIGVDLESVFEYDERGHSVGFGYGRVDAANAVAMAESFTLMGACTDACFTCRNGQCASRCDQDLDCPGQSVCLEDEEGVKACQWPEAADTRIGANCSDACDQCVRVVSQGQTFRNLCSATCAENEECPGGWICAPVGDQGKLCVPGFPGCGSRWGDERCTGGLRVLDAQEQAFCSCPCYPGEAQGSDGYCPEGFHCGTPQCRCTRQGRGGCRETTCEEVTGRGNYNPVCFPDVVEQGPCEADSDCPLGDACVDYECREDPFFCAACAPCERHSDCGQGNWCTPVDGRNVCLVACPVDRQCPGDSICRSISANGRQRRFCLNDPEETSDRVCPADYICRSPQGRCRVAADCPTRDHWCDDEGECRLDDPEPVEPPAPPPITPTGEVAPVSGCTCAQTAPLDTVAWVMFLAIVLRRRVGVRRQAG